MTKDDEYLLGKIIKAQNKARLGVLYAPASFKAAEPMDILKVVNGCGAEGAKFDFVPDSILWVYIGYACIIHDWMYYKGLTDEDKQEADRVFGYNGQRIISKATGWLRKTRRVIMWTYTAAVKTMGGEAFWAGKTGNV